eukprot:TRINITY_DN784_c0_g2_i1.p1 TRINITY_DN784_c0_g2~~TRINITY_DN784_c0_g2_i1.p1  ORF type:complete len:95 (-),score=8.44 TRINITY_DN784_c0_g2_i1:121-381(-)
MGGEIFKGPIKGHIEYVSSPMNQKLFPRFFSSILPAIFRKTRRNLAWTGGFAIGLGIYCLAKHIDQNIHEEHKAHVSGLHDHDEHH